MLFFLLGFFTASFGQSYALNFDGINDFAELDINVPTRHLEPENFTLEFIIDHDISDEGVLISQMANQLFEIGITRELNVYTEINGNRYVFNEFIIEPSSCFHLSLVYLAEEMLFYVDGILIQTHTKAYTGSEITSNSKFYLGQAPHGGKYYKGLIDQIRCFADAMTNSFISSNVYSQIPNENLDQFFYFDFNSYNTDARLRGANNSVTFLYRGGVNYSPNYAPSIVEGECEYEPLETESVSSLCPSITCVPPTVPSNELICNGDFEQFCNGPAPSLENPPAWASPYDAFGLFSANAVAGSDVANMEAIQSGSTFWSQYPSNWPPALFVRDGLGTQNNVGFTAWLDMVTGLQPNLGNNNIHSPPTGSPTLVNNDAYVGLIYDAGEAVLKTDIKSALKPNGQYTFSGWFYNTHWSNNSGVSWPYQDDQMITLEFHSSTHHYQAATLNVPHFTKVTSNNGWSFVTISFSTPGSLPPGLDVLTIIGSNDPNNCTQCGLEAAIFMDDISLLEIAQGRTWPQHVNVGTPLNAAMDGNDSFITSVKTDANNNVYVLHSLRNDNLQIEYTRGNTVQTSFTTTEEEGSLLAKYSGNGTLLWTKFYPHVTFSDIEINANGDVIAGGYTEEVPITYFLTSNPATTFVTNTPWGNINFLLPKIPITFSATLTANTNSLPWSAAVTPTFNTYNTVQFAIALIDQNTGNATINAYGGFSDDRILDVEIVNGKAYAFYSMTEEVAGSLKPEDIGDNVAIPLGAWSNDPVPWTSAVINLLQADNILWFDPISLQPLGDEIYTYPLDKPDSTWIGPGGNSISRGFTNEFDFIMFGSNPNTNSLFTLSPCAIQKFDVQNMSTPPTYGYLRGNFFTGSLERARTFHVDEGQTVYVSHENGNFHSEEISQGTLQLESSQVNSSTYVPFSITSNANYVFIMFQDKLSDPGTSNLSIEKRLKSNAQVNLFNPNHLIWKHSTENDNMNMTDFQSIGVTNTALSTIFNGSDVVYSLYARNTSTSWEFGEQSNYIENTSAPTLHEFHSFIGTVYEDFQGNPSYKNNSTGSGEVVNGNSSLKRYENLIEVYPNPSEGTINIASSREVLDLRVYDLQGRPVRIEEISESRTQFTLNPSAKGVYILVINLDGAVRHERIILE